MATRKSISYGGITPMAQFTIEVFDENGRAVAHRTLPEKLRLIRFVESADWCDNGEGTDSWISVIINLDLISVIDAQTEISNRIWDVIGRNPN